MLPAWPEPQGGSGKTGVVLALPSGSFQAAGSREVIKITERAAAAPVLEIRCTGTDVTLAWPMAP